MFYRCENGDIYNGGCCPKCLSTKIDFSETSTEHPHYIEYMHCESCNYRWKDIYKLQGYED